MNQQKQTRNVICTSPEKREFILSALNSALRWYALTAEKRKEDDQDAVILLDLMEEIKTS